MTAKALDLDLAWRDEPGSVEVQPSRGAAASDWCEDTAPEAAAGPRAATAAVASGVVVAARRAAVFVFASLGALLLSMGFLLWLFS